MTAMDDLDVIDALTPIPNSFAARASAALRSVLELHAAIEAVNVRYGNVQKVCIACGTDDGNWQFWPCPTVRLVEEGMHW